jgi:teichuronic acid biosynthesis glycosyltransferase TuaC
MSSRQPDVRLLTYTNLYPSSDLPRHGVFVEERLRHLVATGSVTADVIALRPRNTLSPRVYAGLADDMPKEERHGIPITYVSVPTLPMITNWIDPILWARATKRTAQRMLDKPDATSVIDAHFLYPDAVAAVILGRKLGIAVVMTARGSDVNVKCESAAMRRWVLWAARNCAAVITVSQALADKLINMGVARESIHVLPNGVDLDKFSPRSTQVPSRVSSTNLRLLSAGHLVEGKGHHVVIEALQGLPNATLKIVGEGPEEQSLRDLAIKLGVMQRVQFLGYVPHDKMADIYSAADFTVLASANEGMPNVILESIACGTRVIATDVGGIGEVITDPVAGILMKSRDAFALQESVRVLSDGKVERNSTRQFANRFGWEETVRRQLALYEQVVGR